MRKAQARFQGFTLTVDEIAPRKGLVRMELIGALFRRRLITEHDRRGSRLTLLLRPDREPGEALHELARTVAELSGWPAVLDPWRQEGFVDLPVALELIASAIQHLMTPGAED